MGEDVLELNIRIAYDRVGVVQVQEDNVQDIIQWQRPEAYWIKINCDGSFDYKTRSAGIGAIAKNPDGQMLDGVGNKVVFDSSAIAEVVAVQAVMDLAVKNNY
ncbi:hypothetical protein REPUB_Repub02eG0182600 [Reevesia pubescens]